MTSICRAGLPGLSSGLSPSRSVWIFLFLNELVVMCFEGVDFMKFVFYNVLKTHR